MAAYADDLALVAALRGAEPEAWRRFVARYSGTILKLLRPWCESTCRKPRDQYQCALQVVRDGPRADRETCDESMDMYVFAFEALRSRVVKYQGRSSLATFISALMRFIHHDYFRHKFQRISVPAALKDLGEREQTAYRLMRRGKEEFEIAQELGIGTEEARACQERVRAALRRRGEEWEHLDGWLAAQQPALPLVQTDSDGGDESRVDIPTTDRPPEQGELLERLRAAFGRLAPAQQRVLELRFGRDFSAEQIAALGRTLPALGVTEHKETYRLIDKAVTRWLELVRADYGGEMSEAADVRAAKEALPDFFRMGPFRVAPENEPGRAV